MNIYLVTVTLLQAQPRNEFLPPNDSLVEFYALVNDFDESSGCLHCNELNFAQVPAGRGYSPSNSIKVDISDLAPYISSPCFSPGHVIRVTAHWMKNKLVHAVDVQFVPDPDSFQKSDLCKSFFDRIYLFYESREHIT